MTENITKLIKSIDDTLDWFSQHKPEQYEQQFRDLVAKRLELRTILETLADNPGIAAYGESQKGKSYLMSNLLQDNGSPFMVLGPEGKQYNYVTELNPPGKGQEATGVVTRFTSFKNSPERYSAEYPALMRVHRVHEVVIILSDAYHFDVIDYLQWQSNELENLTEGLKRYASHPDAQSIVVEDDIIAIKNYLRIYVNGAQLIANSDYLDTLASVIRKVPMQELASVFAPLWHNQDEVTELFERLLAVLKRLDFAKEIYLPMDAIEHFKLKPRTIMSVQCLQGLYMSDFEYTTDAYLRKGDNYEKISDINRSHLSAVCREIVLKVEDRYLNCHMSYDTTMIPDSVKARIPRLEFKRDLLSHADLLDFPGARNREKLLRKNLNNVDSDTGEHNMIKLLLRGKIAYLFNHYNSARALNLLMFCHDTKNVGVTEMYQVIEKWINTYVGADQATRAKSTRDCGGIPPFFVISTMFNLDMIENLQDPSDNSIEALDQRWINRFNILYKESFHAGTDVKWFKSWSANESKFNNIFVLRDFKFSAVGGDGSNLYHGFTSESPEEKSLAISESHFANMRSSFINMLSTHKILKGMVADPELSWDLSATINNDGSVYIIDRLTTVAANLDALRRNQFSGLIGEVCQQMISLLETVYVNPEGGDPILETKRNVGMMRLAFDNAANTDNYFFGRLMESLQVNIREMYKVVQKTLNDTSVTENVHGAHSWEIIRRELEKCKTKEECYEKLMNLYGCTTLEELRRKTEAMGIDIDEIINNREPSPKMSDVIAERVFKTWTNKLANSSNARKACGNVLDLTPFGILCDKLQLVAERYGLKKIMAERIADITDVTNIATVNQYEVADTLAITINEFVKDWGYSYFDKSKLGEYEGYDIDNKFNIFPVINAKSECTFDEDSLTALFARLTSNADGLSDSFYNNYRKWFAFLTLAFLKSEVEVGNVIKHPEANKAAGSILYSLKEAK